MTNWYQLSTQDVLARLRTDRAQGLDPAEVTLRARIYGLNELVERGLKSPWRILWEQLTAIMVVVLLIAAGVSVIMGDYKDAVAILAIVVLNTALGFSQEYRAEKAMAALKKLAAPMVKVRRDGHVQLVSARELVPGDIVLLETGNLVPGDARLIDGVNLRIQESALTGESEPVEKITDALIEPDLSLGDRRNMVYMGTVVTYGHGEATVAETGMRTQIGRIAEMIQTVATEPTPLQR